MKKFLTISIIAFVYLAIIAPWFHLPFGWWFGNLYDDNVSVEGYIFLTFATIFFIMGIFWIAVGVLFHPIFRVIIISVIIGIFFCLVADVRKAMNPLFEDGAAVDQLKETVIEKANDAKDLTENKINEFIESDEFTEMKNFAEEKKNEIVEITKEKVEEKTTEAVNETKEKVETKKKTFLQKLDYIVSLDWLWGEE